MLCGMGFVLLVVFLSLIRDPPRMARVMEIKVDHLLAYAWLMLWFAQIVRSTETRLLIAVSLFVLGVTLEYLQGLTDYRTFAYSDMRDDALGIATGFMLGLTPLRNALTAVETALSRQTHR